MKIIFLWLICFSCIANAQTGSGYIDSMKIIPAIPTEDDTVMLVSYNVIVSAGGTPVAKYDETLTQTDSIFYRYACYLNGQLPAEVNVTDTVYLGKLNPGNYRVLYILKQPYAMDIDTTEDCRSFPYYDSTYANFTVRARLTNMPFIYGPEVGIYPNPAESMLSIVCQEDGEELRSVSIFSCLGNLLRQIPLTGKQTTIDVGDIPGGVYFINIQQGERLVTKMVFVKKAS